MENNIDFTGLSRDEVSAILYAVANISKAPLSELQSMENQFVIMKKQAIEVGLTLPEETKSISKMIDLLSIERCKRNLFLKALKDAVKNRNIMVYDPKLDQPMEAMEFLTKYAEIRDWEVVKAVASVIRR